MKKQRGAIDFSGIEKAIITVKGQNVIIDSDVARIYGVETREVNQAIKNNPEKFPAGYIGLVREPGWFPHKSCIFSG